MKKFDNADKLSHEIVTLQKKFESYQYLEDLVKSSISSKGIYESFQNHLKGIKVAVK